MYREVAIESGCGSEGCGVGVMDVVGLVGTAQGMCTVLADLRAEYTKVTDLQYLLSKELPNLGRVGLCLWR